jgi:hypothetical protein
MRGVVVGAGKRLDEVGQRLATPLTRLFTSRDLQESNPDWKKPNASPTSATLSWVASVT